MRKVVTFGEIMLRLAPEDYMRLVQANKLEVAFGGSEANVAVSLENFGIPSLFVTKVPPNAMGQAAINSMRRYGVDTSHIVKGGERLGIYFLEKGASQRGSTVVYDRAHTAISDAVETDFDWEQIFEGADWFHFSGITPALSTNLVAICKKACKVAKVKGISISCDLNYRKNLWTVDAAAKVMCELMHYVDVCIINEEHARTVLGVELDKDGDSLEAKDYEEIARQLTKMYSFKQVALTLRQTVTATDNYLGAMLYQEDKCYFSKRYLMHIVDRVGGGDAFAAGLIYSLLQSHNPKDTVEFACAAACLKHTIEGDYNQVSVEEVAALTRGSLVGRVQR